MEKSAENANPSLAYGSNNPEPPSLKESEQAEEYSLRSAAEYDLKEKVTPP